LGCKNRYVDEFLRFCQEQFGHSDAKQVSGKQIKAFGESLSESPNTLKTTRTKVAEILAWFRWLSENGLVENDPGKNYQIGTLVAETRRGG